MKSPPARTVFAGHRQRNIHLPDIVERKTLVEEADERPDRAGRVVVFRLGQKQRGPPFEIAQIDVVAERRAGNAAAEETTSTTSGSGLFQLDFGCRPASIPAPTDDSTGALVKISASSADADFEILAPGLLRDQHLLETHGFRRPRFQLRQIVADKPRDFGPDRGSRGWIAAGALLDYPLQHRHRKGDAGRLDDLQIDRRQ